jgi:hypothetical protein
MCGEATHQIVCRTSTPHQMTLPPIYSPPASTHTPFVLPWHSVWCRCKDPALHSAPTPLQGRAAFAWSHHTMLSPRPVLPCSVALRTQGKECREGIDQRARPIRRTDRVEGAPRRRRSTPSLHSCDLQHIGVRVRPLLDRIPCHPSVAGKSKYNNRH